MIDHRSGKSQVLQALNEQLWSHRGYETGMVFLDLDERAFSILDPRRLQVQRGERPLDFSDAPFEDAIAAVAAA